MYYIIVNYICQYKEMIMKRDYTNPKWDKVYEGLLKDPSELSFCFKYGDNNYVGFSHEDLM